MGVRAKVCLYGKPRMKICVNNKHMALWLNDSITISEDVRIEPTKYLYDVFDVSDSDIAFDITMNLGVVKRQIGTGMLGTFRFGVEPNAALGSEVAKMSESFSVTPI